MRLSPVCNQLQRPTNSMRAATCGSYHAICAARAREAIPSKKLIMPPEICDQMHSRVCVRVRACACVHVCAAWLDSEIKARAPLSHTHSDNAAAKMRKLSRSSHSLHGAHDDTAPICALWAAAAHYRFTVFCPSALSSRKPCETQRNGQSGAHSVCACMARHGAACRRHC